MRYLALLTPFLLSAAAVPVTESEQAPTWRITNFRARTYPDRKGANINYNLEIPSLVKTHCHYTDTTSGPKLPGVSQVYCDDAAVRWQLNQDPSIPQTEGLYRIIVIYTSPASPHVVTARFHEWHPDDFPLHTASASNWTIYEGPRSFAVDKDA